MNIYVIKCSRILAYSRPHSLPFPPQRSNYCHRHVRLLARKISKIEHKLKLNCEETTSRLTLKQLQRRVERIERHLKEQNQPPKVALSVKHCLKLLLPEAKNWHNLGIMLDIPETTLEQIEADYPGDCRQCLREMIKSWLKQINPPPSWKDLAEAANDVNPNLARKVRKYALNATD